MTLARNKVTLLVIDCIPYILLHQELVPISLMNYFLIGDNYIIIIIINYNYIKTTAPISQQCYS